MVIIFINATNSGSKKIKGDTTSYGGTTPTAAPADDHKRDSSIYGPQRRNLSGVALDLDAVRADVDPRDAHRVPRAVRRRVVMRDAARAR
jgi:hypothetical protein